MDVRIEITNGDATEIPELQVSIGGGDNGALPQTTRLSLEFCASPEFEEVRRLGAVLAGAGRAPFMVHTGAEKTERPTLRAAVQVIMANARKGLDIQRYKGLGEMNPEQLWKTTMNPETRTLLQVRVDDSPEADLIFSMLMGY